MKYSAPSARLYFYFILGERDKEREGEEMEGREKGERTYKGINLVFFISLVLRL